MRRLLFTPRWLALTAVLIVLVVGFCLLGWWQAQRAFVDGNARSFGYAFEWPVFAIMVIVMYVKTFREEWRGEPARSAEPSEPRKPRTNRQRRAAARRAARRLTATSARSLASAANREDASDDDELAAYNMRLAQLSANAQRQAR